MNNDKTSDTSKQVRYIITYEVWEESKSFPNNYHVQVRDLQTGEFLRGLVDCNRGTSAASSLKDADLLIEHMTIERTLWIWEENWKGTLLEALVEMTDSEIMDEAQRQLSAR